MVSLFHHILLTTQKFRSNLGLLLPAAVANTAIFPASLLRQSLVLGPRLYSFQPPFDSAGEDSQPAQSHVFDSTIQTLRRLTSWLPESTSNRQRFLKLQPDPKTLGKLDELGVGQVKPGWIRYNQRKGRDPTPVLPQVHIKMPFFDFFAGATTPSSFPPETLPEIGFVGRSNVGKSTMLNSLGNSTMARVSEKPGMTQQINFYSAGKDFHIVDMPGYGFAYAKESVKETWVPLIEEYIKTRRTLKRVFVLLDARHGIKHVDQKFLDLLDRANVKYQLVLTKCDLVSREVLARRHLLITEATKHSTNCNNQVFMVSARSNGGKGSGFNELRKEILHMMGLGKKYLAGVKRQEALARTQQQEILAKKNNKQGKRKRE